MTLTIGTMMFVASSRPPSPVSMTATSTSLCAKKSNAMAAVISKNESPSSTILSWCLSTKFTTFCLGIISPSTRMRSRKSARWGEVKSPVR